MEKEFILFTSKLFALQAENEDRFECELLFIYLQKTLYLEQTNHEKYSSIRKKARPLIHFFGVLY